jgi:uncharacterized membrane protein YidH (DUF202 family)
VTYAPTPLIGPDPHAAMQKERTLLPWARAAICGIGIAQVASAFVIRIVLKNSLHQWHTIIHEIQQHSTTATPVSNPSVNAFTLLYDLVQLGALVVLMIWLFRAASHARDLGLPARRKPVWAVLGFIIPVVSLWFPYQVLADCLAPTDTPGRRMVLWWWLLYLLGQVIFETFGILGYFRPMLTVVGVAVSIVWVAFEIRVGIVMVNTISASHEQATLAYGTPSAS